MIDSQSSKRIDEKSPLSPRGVTLPVNSHDIHVQRRQRRRPFVPIIALFVSLFFILSHLGHFPLSCKHHSSIPPLSPDFLAECNSLLSPEPGTFLSRLTELSRALDGTTWIAEPSPSAYYFFGGFNSKDWSPSERPLLLVASNDNLIILTPAFEELRSSMVPLAPEVKQRVQYVAWAESDSPYQVLKDYLGEVEGVMFDRQVRHFIVQGIEEAFGAKLDKEKQDRVERKVGLIRERKDEREIGLLRCANQMTIHSIRKTRERMHIGIGEGKTAKIFHEEMAKTGLVGGGALILFGTDAALPHGRGTDKKLQREDLVLIDAGGAWGGYVADITRTFALKDSKIPQSHIDLWHLVRKAQRAPYDLLKSSNVSEPPKLGQLDATARNVITSHLSSSSLQPDFSAFTHRLGHGIGLEGHEAPYVVQGPLGEKRVEPGHVFSLEPGVYFPDNDSKGLALASTLAYKGVGVRLEDCFAVKVDKDGNLGGEWLSGPVEKWGDI